MRVAFAGSPRRVAYHHDAPSEPGAGSEPGSHACDTQRDPRSQYDRPVVVTTVSGRGARTS